MSKIYIIKRNGKKELLNYEKINKVLEWSVEGINGVNASDVAMNAQLQIFDGITSEQIHQILIKAATDMITIETPNYQFVASKLLNYLLRKEVFNTYNNFPRLKDFVNSNVNSKVYDPLILDKYDDYDFDKIERFVKHNRDEELTYSGLQQLIDKYLVKDRKNGTIYETPQFMYIMIAMTLFADKKGKKRLKMIKTFYELISTHKISLPTPIVAGVRTPTRQYSSCVLIDTGDNLDSIFSSNTAVGKYISKRAGIGLNFRIRGINSTIRNGEAVHTGIIPFLKMFEGTVKSCSQGGIRGGASTAHYPFWHIEIEDILVLKNNRGNELNRVRRMDHSIQLCRLFYKRFLDNKDITLFSPSDVPGLYDSFGDNEKFEELYIKYENDKSINNRKVNARKLMDLLIQERIETGRIYIQNIDNANIHSAFKGNAIRMSNLCQEINLKTSPINHIDDGKIVNKNILVHNDNLSKFNKLKDKENELKYYVNNTKDDELQKLYKFSDNSDIEDKENYTELNEKFELVYGDEPAEIALCVLSAINLGTINKFEDLEVVCEYAVRALDYVIDRQDYPIEAAKKMIKRRSIGIGVTNLAYWLLKNGTSYTHDDVYEKVDELFEHIQYYLLKASMNLAREKGPALYFKDTKYSDGLLPIDHYNKNVDKIVDRKYTLDWEQLRDDIKKYGLRNSTLTAQMPCESSSVVSSSTNGIEPPRSLITTKKSKSGSPLPVVVPEIQKYKNKYEFSWEFDNDVMNNITAVIQKWFDQGISVNHYYDSRKYDDNDLPLSVVAKDILNFYKFGGKQLYYANSKDYKSDKLEEMISYKDNEQVDIPDDANDCGDACTI